MIGVSPAYFISRHTDRFRPADVAEGLADLAALGYRGFQLEVFHRDTLNEWRASGARLVRERAAALGLKAHQFVAHFMLAAFATPDALCSPVGLEEMKAVLDIVAPFDECRVVTVPLPAFLAPPMPGAETYRCAFERCAGKVSRLLALVEDAGRRLALEIMPGAVLGGTDGFLRLCDHLCADSLGLNFDTGHAWACKENVYMIPAKVEGRILGTHLCDNVGHENLSLCPGDGSIDWPRLVGALTRCGYGGPWDIEIACPSAVVADEYGKGLKFIATLLR